MNTASTGIAGVLPGGDALPHERDVRRPDVGVVEVHLQVVHDPGDVHAGPIGELLAEPGHARGASGMDSTAAAMATTVTRSQTSAAVRIRKWWPGCGG